jgi:threonine/homoserine/homoserine lactone efflux protein
MLGYTLPLFLGFLTASAGITPPGLINMTAARVSLDEGRSKALIFALGATIVVVVQTLVALVFAKFIDSHPNITLLLREATLVIFLLLTVYFFMRGSKVNNSPREFKFHSKKSRFFLGMLLAALNFLPIPFYVFISITLSAYNFFIFSKPFIYLFVVGAALGSYFTFWCYIAFFARLETRSSFLLKNMNFIMGSVTALVSLLTFANIVSYFAR